MEKYEKRTLLGVFLILMGVFLPWYAKMEYFNTGSQLSQRVTQIKNGYEFLPGWIILAVCTVMAVIVLMPISKQYQTRVLASIFFMNMIVLGIYSITGIGAVIFESMTSPRFGLLFIPVGIVVTVLGLRQAKKESAKA